MEDMEIKEMLNGGKDELERLFLCLTKKQKQIVVLSVILSACAGKAIHEQS